MAAPVFASVEKTKSTSGGPMTGNKPLSVASGDLLIASCVVQSSSTSLTITAPAGWTLVYSSTIGGTTDKIHAVYYRVAGSSEPSSWSWTLANGATIHWACAVARITGASVGYPINASNVSDNASSANATAAAIVTTTNDCKLIFTSAEPNGRTYSVAATFSGMFDDRVTGTYDDSHYGMQKTFATAGSTGTVTATMNAPTVHAAGLIAIAPLGYAPPSAAITGTATASITEADVVAGGKTIIITLTNDTWVAAGATFDAQRQAIINGIDSAQAEATGWDAVVKALQGVAGVVRTSATVVTITLDAQATYNITATETITVTVPSAALTGAGGAVVATPTFAVTAVASSNGNRNLLLMGCG